MSNSEIFTKVYVPDDILKKAVKDWPKQIKSVLDDCRKIIERQDQMNKLYQKYLAEMEFQRLVQKMIPTFQQWLFANGYSDKLN